MLKILFVCRNFNQMAGGIERISSLIMNEMINRGHQVILLTWDQTDSTAHYVLDPKIKWIKLNIGEAINKANWNIRLKRQIKIRKIIKGLKPSVAIGFQVGTFIAIRSALLGLGIPIIAAERNSPDLFKFQKKGERNRILSSIALLFASRITIQFESYKEKYPFFLRSLICTIHNPVEPPNQKALPKENKNKPKRILNVGRLSYQKNQLFLIRSFAMITIQNPNWILTIVGEGEYRKRIESLIIQEKLQDHIELIGAVEDIDFWYENSSFLAFPSLWEGFPNVLAESFRKGLPAIGFQKTAGVNQLIKHNYNGLLVKDNEKDYALAMQQMINNEIFRKKAGRVSLKSINRYQPNKVFNKWENLFQELSKK